MEIHVAAKAFDIYDRTFLGNLVDLANEMLEAYDVTESN
jgi:hypothetical protein